MIPLRITGATVHDAHYMGAEDLLSFFRLLIRARRLSEDEKNGEDFVATEVDRNITRDRRGNSGETVGSE